MFFSFRHFRSSDEVSVEDYGNVSRAIVLSLTSCIRVCKNLLNLLLLFDPQKPFGKVALVLSSNVDHSDVLAL